MAVVNTLYLYINLMQLNGLANAHMSKITEL
jgi:hypothetical protein